MPKIGVMRPRALKIGSMLKCVDTTGAKYMQIIDVIGKQGRKNRLKSASIGDIVKVTVKSGTLDYRKKMALALVVRTRRQYYDRSAGYYVGFRDNAAVLVEPSGKPISSTVKGVIPKFIFELRPQFRPNNCRVIS